MPQTSDPEIEKLFGAGSGIHSGFAQFFLAVGARPAGSRLREGCTRRSMVHVCAATSRPWRTCRCPAAALPQAWPVAQAALEELVVGPAAGGPVPQVWVAGHSMGGAVAHLVAYASQEYLNKQLGDGKVSCPLGSLPGRQRQCPPGLGAAAPCMAGSHCVAPAPAAPPHAPAGPRGQRRVLLAAPGGGRGVRGPVCRAGQQPRCQARWSALFCFNAFGAARREEI